MTRKASAQLCLAPSWIGIPCSQPLRPDHLILGVLQHALEGSILVDYLEATAGAECRCMTVLRSLG